MNYLRFSPQEYRAISHLCGPLDLSNPRLSAFRRFLVECLGERHPELAARIGRFRAHEVKILYDHLRRRRAAGPADPSRELTADELQMLTGTYGPLLCHARFRRPLRRSLIQHFRESRPELAWKLDQLSLAEFELLCEQVKEQRSEGA